MLPRWHIIFGLIFAISIWVFAPRLNFVYVSLIFLSSFLIDFDHYLVSLIKTKKFSLRDSFRYHDMKEKEANNDIKKGVRRRGDFHLFHTVEFHALVGVIGISFAPFFYIFIGMLFHSLLDVISLIYDDTFHRREYFFFNWLRKKF